VSYKKKENSKDVILIVDDQPINLKVAASVLGEDYTLSIANNGKNALKLLEIGTPDLILLDVMMPEMDGFEVCKIIKENEKTKDIPVIFLTAKTDIRDIIKGFEYGAVDYITKPFHPTEVKVRVKNHLNLYHAKNEIAKINSEKDKFFSIIAHDLRSPLASISGLCDLLILMAESNNTDGLIEYAELIHQASKKSIDLLSNLMAWALAQTGMMEFKPEPVRIGELLNENMLLYFEVASQKSITIKVSKSDDVELFIDKAMINTVLRNLINNAIKFTYENGEIDMTMELKNDLVEITVSDNGMGMKPELIQELFKLDKKTGRPGTHGESSTGLGLLLCKEFIEIHGGQLWADSDLGKGSDFHFTIPLRHKL
jgi:signal transduction histidine kinase